MDLKFKRYFFKNYGGHIVHQFKSLNGNLELIVHEGFYDVGVGAFPFLKSLVSFWYVRKGRKKVAEGFDVESLNEYLKKNNVKLLDEAGEEVCF